MFGSWQVIAHELEQPKSGIAALSDDATAIRHAMGNGAKKKSQTHS
jgi:hypothetical protein